jgi:nitroreductase
METFEALRTRRSVRKFKPVQVDPEVLDKVLEAATYSPCGKGLQAAQIVVVQDAETLAQLRRMNAAIWDKNIDDPYFGAPTIVLVLSPNDVPTYVEDGACVLTYMMLAAHDAGLASVWVHRERQMFASDEGKELIKKWGLPDKMEGIGSLAIGYAEGDLRVAPPRREDYILKV